MQQEIQPFDRIQIKPDARPHPRRIGDVAAVNGNRVTVLFEKIEQYTYDTEKLVKLEPASIKIAFIDIDGILADNTKRVLDCTKEYDSKTGKPVLDWDEFFKPERVEQDTLIAAAPERLEMLANKGYEIILLTGRPAFAPHCLESVTASWLARQGITTPHTLLCKPEEAKYVKTAAWKASVINAIARLMKATELVIVDDDPRNAAAHVRNDHYFVMHFDHLADTSALGES